MPWWAQQNLKMGRNIISQNQRAYHSFSYKKWRQNMPFPETERVIYRKNPLNKVICQLRYPPILRIDSEVPSNFQDTIREAFPLYNEKVELQQETAIGLKSQIPPELIKQLTKTSVNKNHEFSSEDGIWKINLTRTFVSISTSQYTRWEDFEKMFKPSIDALLDIYKPPFFTRAGIRYVDIFERSRLGLLPNCKWTELLKPYFSGLLSTEVGSNIKHFENVYEISLNDSKSMVRIATSFVQNAQSKEQCYMVDSDLYLPSRVKPKELEDKLDFLHKRATRLIRWIITEKLHNTMEPEKI